MPARWLAESEQKTINETGHVCFVNKFTRVKEASAIEKIRLL